MELERWRELYGLACRLGKRYPQGVKYSVALIVGVFLWAVVNYRPICWACDEENWPASLAMGRLPDQSVMSRRLRSPAVQQLLDEMEQELRQQGQPHWIKMIDSKPLVVAAHSKDLEAHWGRIAQSRCARGYKLHAVWDGRTAPAAWAVEPMNTHETTVAMALLPQLKGSGYLLGDVQYNSNRLYDQAGRHAHQLVAPRRKSRKGGLGHHYHSPYRLRSIELLEHPFGKALLQERTSIERVFGGMTCFGGGLAPLPAWVRTLARVRRWVQGKILINAIRLKNRRRLAAA
jgi:hypothetical protein